MSERTDITLQEIAVVAHEGEPRARDLDIAERLGMSRPRDIRKILARHRGALEGFGPVVVVQNEYRGQRRDEWHLNEEQALYAATVSDAPNAPAVRSMLIRTFVAWRRGHLMPTALDERTIGGINKGVVRKAISDLMPGVLTEALTVLLPAMVREHVASQHHAVIDGVSAGQVMEMAGYPKRKGLRGIPVWVSHRLRRFHAQRGVAVRLASLGSSNAYVFDPLTSREWLSEGGKAELDQKIAERRGQGALRLIRPAAFTPTESSCGISDPA